MEAHDSVDDESKGAADLADDSTKRVATCLVENCNGFKQGRLDKMHKYRDLHAGKVPRSCASCTTPPIGPTARTRAGRRMTVHPFSYASPEPSEERHVPQSADFDWP